jgi:hypothetical protein
MAEKLIVDIEFKTNLAKATKDIEAVKDTLKETNENLEDIAKTGKSTDGSLKKMSKGFKGMGLAMKTLGVGLIIEAFTFLKDIMMKNQTVMDGVSIATETIGVIFNQVTSVITDVFDAVGKSSEGFEGLQKVMSGLLTIAISPLKLGFFSIKLGIQEAQLIWENSFFGDGNPETIAELNKGIAETKASLTDVIVDVAEASVQVATNIGEAVTELGSVVTIGVKVASEGINDISLASSLATGKALAEAKKNEELLEVLRAKQQLTSQLDAELQRQVRDDISKTFKERIDANVELGRILEEQTEKEKKIVDEKVRIAQLELSTNKTSVELQTKYQQSLLEQIDIDERIAGLRSEQLTNEQGLLKEQEEAILSLSLAGKSSRELEMEEIRQDYDAKIELARKSGADTEAITNQFNQNILDANSRFAQEDLDVFNKKEADKRAIQQATVDIGKQNLQLLSGLLEEGSKEAKAVAIAQTIMTTYEGMQKAITGSAGLPIVGVAMGYVNAGLILATGLKNIKKISSTKPKKSGGGSVSSSGGGGASGGASGSAGGEIADLSNLPSITEQFNDQFGQGEQQPVQAYVVEQDVTSSQQINTMIQQKAEL